MYKIDGGRFKNHSLGQTLAFFKGSVLENDFWTPPPLFLSILYMDLLFFTRIYGQFLIHVTIGTTKGRIYLSTLLW